VSSDPESGHNQAGAGNGAGALLSHVEALGRAVPDLCRSSALYSMNLKKASNCSVGAQDRPENQGFWTLLLHCTKANPGVALVQDAKRHA
jgi:hypothetical protein